MRVLSLFDGISCGMVALERAAIPVEEYIAYEIEPSAIKISEKNYPQIIHCGDVTKADFTQYKGKIDLLIGGSPCQGFSFAGKQLNFEDPRSKLFFEYVRALKEVSPKYFLLENVKMKKEWIKTISDCLGVEPIAINSSLVSAQNRARLYWTNIPNVTQPEDRHIFLQDVLDPSETAININSDNKARTLTHNYDKQSVGNFIGAVGYGSTGKYKPVCVASRGRNPANPTSREKGIPTEQRFEAKTDGKTNTLTTVQKDNLIAEPCCMRYERTTEGKALRKQYESHELHHGYNEYRVLQPRPDGQTNALTSVQKDNLVCQGCNEHIGEKDVYRVVNGQITVQSRTYPIKLEDGCYMIRRLSPVECERLQTLPDGYTDGVANTHRYHALGNGWTVDVITHIFKNLKGDI